MINKKNKIAILTPTYNRESLIKRAFESLKNQTNKNFVWYVVDDGSTDNTEEVINQFEKLKNSGFDIQYIKKENGGKHTALNVGLKQIKEDYVMILDSDDQLTKDAVDTMVHDIPQIEEENFCGIGYLRVKTDGSIIGRNYTKDGIEDTFINQRYNKNTFGDKAEVFKTNILKQYPFPEFKGEKFLSESTIWCKMSGPYLMKFFNKGIYICEYQEGGLSDGVKKRMFKNPLGASECYKTLSQKDFKLKMRIKYTIAYIVYSLAAGKNKQQIIRESNNKFLTTILFLVGKILYLKKRKKYQK